MNRIILKKYNIKFPNLINHLIKLISLHLYVNIAKKRILLYIILKVVSVNIVREIKIINDFKAYLYLII